MSSPALIAEPRTKARWWLAGLVALVVLTYLPTLHNGFIWDDDSYIEHNVTLRSLYGLWLIWSHTSSTPQYYPLVHTTFWIEYHLWGLWPLPYHLLNVSLHATSALLLFKLLTKLNVRGAWLAAAIWAVHPLNVESVAWATERKNVMSAVLYLAAFTVYLRAIAGDETDKPIDRRRYLIALGLFVAALLSKTVASTMPAAILVVLWWQRGRLVRRDFVRLIPFFIIGAVMGSLTGYLERTQVGAHGLEWSSITPVDRVLIASRAAWFYAAKFAWPAKLIFIYPRWMIDRHSLSAWTYFIAATILFGSLVFTWRRWGRGPLALGLLYIGTLAPALGFVNVYPMKFSFVADHFAYLASAALAIAAGWALAWRGGNTGLLRTSKTGLRIVGVVIVLALAARSFARELVFYDRITLWRQTAVDNENSPMVHTNLGHALVATHQPDAAWLEYQRALALAPNDTEPHINIGIGLAMRGDLNGAARQFEQVVAIDPTYLSAYGYLAKLYVDAKQFDLAEQWAHKGLVEAPDAAISHMVLAHVYQAEGRIPVAVDQFQLALREEPTRADLHTDLAVAFMKENRLPDALLEFEKSVALDPTDARAWTTLGSLYRAGGQPDEAANCFRRAIDIDPNNRQAIAELAQLTGAGKAP